MNDPSQDLTQLLTNVYTDADARAYVFSSYSYVIVPTTIQGQLTMAKGNTLGAFLYYAMCQAQREAPSLGYSAVPINLVTASFGQIAKIPASSCRTSTSRRATTRPTRLTGPTRSPTRTQYRPRATSKGRLNAAVAVLHLSFPRESLSRSR